MKRISLTIVFYFFTLGATNAQYNVLFNFNGNNGGGPTGSLLKSGNTLYGRSNYGGVGGAGNIFSIDTNGGNFHDLFDFNNSQLNYSNGGLTLCGSVLYGMANDGGVNGHGGIFSIHTDGSGYKDMHDFSSNCGVDAGSLIVSGNRLFGMAYFDGLNGDGCVFSIDTSGKVFKDIYDFTYPQDGQHLASLILSGKILYGMAFNGGVHGFGCIFSLDTAGVAYTDLYDFDSIHGSTPYGSLVLVGNKLYGETLWGGANNDGVIFSVNINGSNYKDLVDFNGKNGNSSIFGSLTPVGAQLYGLTESGGDSNAGCIFSIDTNGSNYKVLYSFDSVIGGRYPIGSLTSSGDILYGTTSTADSDGTIFSFNLSGLNGIPIAKDSSICCLSVYPNPNNGIFNLQLGIRNYESCRVEVYNALVEQVYQKTLRPAQGDNYGIDLSNEASGIYLYRVLSEDGRLLGTGKFVIEK
jgi:uncharacterized repeat protein (TIGR03803 family)